MKFFGTLAFLTSLFVLLANGSDATQRVDPSTSVNWNSDNYHVALWKLYHTFKVGLGHPWEDFQNLFDIQSLEEISSANSQYTIVHRYRFQEKALKSLHPTHEMRLTVTLEREKKLIKSIEPSIVFTFADKTTLGDLSNIFGGSSVVTRMIGLHSFRGKVKNAPAVQSIEVTFQHLANHNIEWNCNGFYIRTLLAPKGAERDTVNYFVGSGLDPFTDWLGHERPMQFGPQDILIDPEWGGDCEEEDSGARVFIEWP